MTTNNPNPLYPKGSTYRNYTELGPVLDAAVSSGSWVLRWYEDGGGNNRPSVPFPNEFPIRLITDIQAPYKAPEPLTVEEKIQLIQEGDCLWYWREDKQAPRFINAMSQLVRHMEFNYKHYATEDDCKRAHDFYEKVEVE